MQGFVVLRKLRKRSMNLDAQTHLDTLFVLDGRRRIVSTREPNPSAGPGFVLIRTGESCVWAVGSGVGEEQAREVSMLALEEQPTADFHLPPKHAEKYREILGGEFDFGPAFEFPELLPVVERAVRVEDLAALQCSFGGWTADEIPGRSPIMGIFEDGAPVSICFSARISELAAEAGVETAPDYRGRGLAGLATYAWATAVRASGRTPIYSTSWSNGPSLAVARKLGLTSCASYWNLSASAWASFDRS